MTPLLPTPDHYLTQPNNHDVSLKPSAFGGAASKNILDAHVFIAEKLMTLHELTIDHVHPRSLGGEDITSNVVPACTRCNQEKGSAHWRSWMRQQFGKNLLREGYWILIN